MLTRAGLPQQKTLKALDSLIVRGEKTGREEAMQVMGETIRECGLMPESLSVIHVAGTKGKGSTCAMSERILRSCGLTTGLYTSPHLCSVTERIRLNGKPVSDDLFSKHFWQLKDKLESSERFRDSMPPYFRFLTLMAFSIFEEAKPDVVVLEVGLGGRLDSTNIIPNPVVCGVSALGYDHVNILGHTLTEIASEKAGIFKVGTPAFTSPQPEEAMNALKRKASDVKIDLFETQPLEAYGGSHIAVGIPGHHQRQNAALAVALCKTWMQRMGLWNFPSKPQNQCQLPAPFLEGLANAEWPGRGHIIKHDDAKFLLDGAHTPESLTAFSKWVETELPKKQETVRRVLLFNCGQERDPHVLLKPVAESDHLFDEVLFVPFDSSTCRISTKDETHDTTWQHQLKECWDSLKEGHSSTVHASIDDALKHVNNIHYSSDEGEIDVYCAVTGSIYLVGDVLAKLGWDGNIGGEDKEDVKAM